MRSLIGVILVAGACGPLPAQRTHQLPHGARALLDDVQIRMKTQAIRELAALFTPHCLRSCRGFVPLPSAIKERTITGHWSPRLHGGLLMPDLARMLLSYEQISSVSLTPVRRLKFPGKVQLRARLLIQGKARGQGAAPSTARGPTWLRDGGLVDLGLSRTTAGWRIDHFAAARVLREVPLPGAAVDAQAAPVPEPPAAERPVPRATTPAPASPIPENFLELTTRGPEGPVALSTIAGPRATLVLIRAAQCAECVETCSQLVTLGRRLPGVSAAVLHLGKGKRSGGKAVRGGGTSGWDRCPLPQLSATVETHEALAGLRSLLPLLVILDRSGKSERIVGARQSADQLQGLIEAD